MGNVNPFLANVPILYLLKNTSKPLVFGVLRGYKMETFARNRLIDTNLIFVIPMNKLHKL